MAVDNEISCIEARDWANSRDDLIMFDMRTEENRSDYELPGFTPGNEDEITSKLPELSLRKTILLICDDGKKSKKMQKIIQACSLKSYIVRGGFNEWREVINPKIKRNFWEKKI